MTTVEHLHYDVIVRSDNRILATKQRDPAADTSALERGIDRLVYALYGLTPMSPPSPQTPSAASNPTSNRATSPRKKRATRSRGQLWLRNDPQAPQFLCNETGPTAKDVLAYFLDWGKILIDLADDLFRVYLHFFQFGGKRDCHVSD